MKKINLFILSLILICSSSLLFAGCGSDDGFISVCSITIPYEGDVTNSYPTIFKSYYIVEIDNKTEVSKEDYENSSRVAYSYGTQKYIDYKKTPLEYKVGDECKYSYGDNPYEKYYFATIKSIEERYVKFKDLDSNKIEIITPGGYHYLFNVSYYEVVYFI